MKGLLLKLTGETEEGYALAKKGVFNNLKSSICWHINGLIFRDDKYNYRVNLEIIPRQ